MENGITRKLQVLGGGLSSGHSIHLCRVVTWREAA